MIWRFSDGTEVELGGIVRGASRFAQELREMLSDPSDLPGIQTRPIPMPGETLNPLDPTLMNAWLEQEARRPWNRDIKLTERPDDIPPLPPVTDEEMGPYRSDATY